jgi:16S rRNA (cytosine967-C5)-methyltransferase
VSINIIRVKKKSLELLKRIEHEGAYTHIVLQRLAESGELAPGEYPILLQLVRGSLEQRGILEERLERLLPKGLGSLPLDVQIILRLSAYQILFLERVRKRDVVFEAVEIAKSGRHRALAGLVNAVLRKIESPDSDARALSDSSATRNFPDWLVDRWSKQHGLLEAQSFCAASGVNLPLYSRVNSSLVSREDLIQVLYREGVLSEPALFSVNSIKITRIPAKVRITQLKSYQDGLFFIQDLSSTIVADVVAVNAPRSVRDLCAAPGGKSASIALSIVESGGIVNASDRSAKRVALIDQLSDRLKLPNLKTDHFELGRAGPISRELSDCVLLDVPCSGFGTVGRKIDVRWSMDEYQLAQLVASQERLLADAARYVAPGGELIYSTCSIDRAENEVIIESFLNSQGDFSIVDLRGELPESLCTSSGFFRSWPQHHEMTGAFAAKMRRKG